MARQPGDSDFTNVNAVVFKASGTKVLGDQVAVVSRVGSALDTNTLVNMVNTILDGLEAHGLFADS